MGEATHRTDVQYVWPETLARPSSAVRLVYLDQKDWINLAKAATGHSDGLRHERALAALRAAQACGDVVFPLSMTHFMEMSGTKSARQRADVAGVMEELSGFATLVPRDVVMRLEFEAVLDVVAKPRPERYAVIPVVGQGAPFAFGRSGQFRVRSGDEDVTEQVREAHPGGAEQFDLVMARAELDLDRALLRGPSDAEAPRLRRYGWDPTVARTIAERRAQEEREQAARFDDPTLVPDDPTDWRHQRLRDVVRTRYVVVELMEMVLEGLGARGLVIEDVWSDVDAARRVVDAMPSADVSVSLMTEYHRNPQFKWSSNDIFDIDALSLAVAYCDLVVTDKQALDALRRSRVEERLGSRVFADLDELVDAIQD